MDIMDIMGIMEVMDIMNFMNIMDIMDIMDIMIITAWLAMAGAVSASRMTFIHHSSFVHFQSLIKAFWQQITVK